MEFCEKFFLVLALVFMVAVTYIARDSHYTIIQLADSQTWKLADSQLAVNLPPVYLYSAIVQSGS